MLEVKFNFVIKIFLVSEELKKVWKVNIECVYKPINDEECWKISLILLSLILLDNKIRFNLQHPPLSLIIYQN